MTKKRFRSSINFPQTKTFPAADTGSDHDLVMMTFRLRLKRVQKETYNIVKFDLNILKSHSILEQLNNISSGKFNSLTDLTDTEIDVNELTNNFNNIYNEMATEISKGRTMKKTWMNECILELCDKRRKLKEQMKVTNLITEYKICNREVRKELKKQKKNGLKTNVHLLRII